MKIRFHHCEFDNWLYLVIKDFGLCIGFNPCSPFWIKKSWKFFGITFFGFDFRLNWQGEEGRIIAEETYKIVKSQLPTFLEEEEAEWQKENEGIQA